MGLVNVAERAKGWLFDVFAHNHAEGLRTDRAIERRAMKLELTDLPYPGSPVINIMNADGTPAVPAPVPPVPPPVVAPGPTAPASAPFGGGWLQTAILAAAILGGGAGSAWLMKPSNPTAPTKIVDPGASGSVQLPEFWDEKVTDEEYTKPDGTKGTREVILSRTKLRQWPDGHMEQQAADGSWKPYP